MVDQQPTPAERAQWGSRLGFILAAAGSAVGLGNIWRFPYTTGDNGGGLFVIIYLLCVALIGLPILMSEIIIGRAAQRQPVGAFEVLQGKKTGWSGVGWLGVIAGFIILSYYVVVAGWAMDYTLKSFVNFTSSMARDAQVEGMTYRVETSPDEIRAMLTQREADRLFNDHQKEISRAVRPSEWKHYQQFAALSEKVGGMNQVRAAFAGDPERIAMLESSITIQSQLAEARASAENDARATFAQFTELQLREEGENVVRRNTLREKVGGAFGAVASDGWITLFWTTIFMLLTILIVAGGISGGIERACTILMPLLFILILTLVLYSAFTPGFGKALAFVFQPDVHELRPSSVLQAMGQAFFSLSLGMGAMITYGSYQRSKANVAGQSVAIASMDTAVAILACLMIFPIVFSFGQEPSAGPGLVFMSMPLAFAEIGTGGMLLSAMFFGLLVFAALTSSISLLEVVASYFIDQRGWPRLRAAWLIGGVILLLAIPSAFAGDPDFALKGWSSYGAGFDFLSTMDYLASNWLLPIGGFFIAVYAGWIMPVRLRALELEEMPFWSRGGFLLLARIVAPAMVVIILLQSIGVLDADELLYGVFH